jgi:predicted hotdog family 3-hydroxylacyl-ACP dehydratase
VNFEKIDILTLLPQRPPFVMVDKLLLYDMGVTETSFRVHEDNIFCDDGRLSESGLIENIAQTCAAGIGYVNKYSYNDAIKLGFIGSIRNMEIFRLPQTGETLTTRICTVEEVFRMTLINAKVTIGQELITSAEMKIAIIDN